MDNRKLKWSWKTDSRRHFQKSTEWHWMMGMIKAYLDFFLDNKIRMRYFGTEKSFSFPSIPAQLIVRKRNIRSPVFEKIQLCFISLGRWHNSTQLCFFKSNHNRHLYPLLSTCRQSIMQQYDKCAHLKCKNSRSLTISIARKNFNAWVQSWNWVNGTQH